MPEVDPIAADLATGKAFLFGKDLKGGPVVYVLARGTHSVYETTAERTERLIVFMVEKAVRVLYETGAWSGTAVVDVSDLGYAGMDVAAARYLIKTLIVGAPAAISHFLIVGSTGLVFTSLWAVVSLMLNERARRKIKFLTKGDREAFGPFIAPDELLSEYGGKADVVLDMKGGAARAGDGAPSEEEGDRSEGDGDGSFS